MRASHLLGISLLPALSAALPGLRQTSHSASHFQARRIGRVNVADVADAQFNFLPYELADVCLDCSRPSSQAQYSCGLNFDWYDPNSRLENNVTSCHCSYTWSWDGVTPIQADGEYVTCFKQGSTLFEMKILDFQSGHNLTLDMGHHYKDSTNFSYPWIYPTTFSTPQLSLPLRILGNNSMTYYDAGPIFANITQLSD
ncbi:hypothetical protein NKR23_g12249 [Pleurostoma richardsiae]|uniref:Uncharacterized protein n=1 Tax=Pleurostoma richardsiae TaxID=41990 RepID=A0AA38R9S2_9PEZI|nr:hypothetical protein NKR23_g12249 [Pleurostoma richardsiae]